MTTGFAYRVYGLRLRADRVLPGLVAVPDDGPPDLLINLTNALPAELSVPAADWVRRPDWEADEHDAVGAWTLQRDGRSHLRLRFAIDDSHAEFITDLAGTRVWARWTDGVAFDDVASFLTGPVLGRVLRLRGVPCLHASVIALGTAACAIVGSKAAGKSTTAAALAWSGSAVLSDDIAALAEAGTSYVVHPGCPRLRLWNPAIEAFYGSRDELPRVLSIRGKRYLDLALDDGATQWRFQAQPLPLAAIYVLGPRRREITAPSVRPLPPAEGLIALTANSYATQILDRTSRAQEFAVLGRLVQHVPVRQVERSDDIGAVQQLCSVIRDDFDQLCSAAGRPS